jgi:hypothetical protein
MVGLSITGSAPQSSHHSLGSWSWSRSSESKRMIGSMNQKAIGEPAFLVHRHRYCISQNTVAPYSSSLRRSTLSRWGRAGTSAPSAARYQWPGCSTQIKPRRSPIGPTISSDSPMTSGVFGLSVRTVVVAALAKFGLSGLDPDHDRLHILRNLHWLNPSMHFHDEICVISCFFAEAVVRYDE